jgi:hypothetical protein
VSDLLLERDATRGSSSPEIEYLTIIPTDIKYIHSPVKPEFVDDFSKIKI